METISLKDGHIDIELPVVVGTEDERGIDISKLRAETGYITLDPGYANTGSCQSAIAFIDGEKGILRYRGIPIEELAEKSTFLEVAYLLINGELPNETEYADWKHQITTHTYVNDSFRRDYFDAFHYDAHPMGLLTSATAGLSTFYPEAKNIEDPEVRKEQMVRLIAKMPTMAAAAYRFSKGLPFVYPDNDLDYSTNFLSMMYRMAEPSYEVNPVLARALDLLFILHADHEQNCSTTAVRVVGSAHADPYSAVSAGCAALYGPRHGGANEAVLDMLGQIPSKDQVGMFVEKAKDPDDPFRLMGFGHRVYKNFDPRATIIKKAAYDVFEVTGTNPLLDIALALEDAALADDYFVSRKLYPNVDFYSGLIYEAIGFPTSMFTVLFAIPRTSGWLAHWNEMLQQDSRIARPRQVYTGSELRDYVDVSAR